jgi:vitamin B12 transport system substrate-binding protein
VLLSQPEVIIKTDEKGDGKRLDWSQWQEIPAVKTEQIYTLNADILHRATPRALEGVEAICKVLDKAREGQRL